MATAAGVAMPPVRIAVTRADMVASNGVTPAAGDRTLLPHVRLNPVGTTGVAIRAGTLREATQAVIRIGRAALTSSLAVAIAADTTAEASTSATAILTTTDMTRMRM